ncbi:hypothetical protein ACJJIR_09830 [Microbulbifer sp. SSSA008]|uniref:hypothetical protein n=1 Tax=Microbulbifer sp. SSSA008 TaxID=3243380 RepID=UPI00403A41BF
MTDFKDIDLRGGTCIRKQVALFEIQDHHRIPYGKYKIKVLMDANNHYYAFPNVAFKDSNDNVDWVCGMGPTILTAVQESIDSLVRSIPSFAYSDNQCFEWSSPEDF